MARVQKKTIAAALGISAGLVTRYSKAGMPVTDVESARRWKAQHIAPRISSRPPPPATALSLAERAIRPGAGLDASVAGLLWAAKPFVLGGLIAGLTERELPGDRGTVGLVFSIIATELALAMERAGEPESALWDLSCPISDDVWQEADAHAELRLAEWRAADEPPTKEPTP